MAESGEVEQVVMVFLRDRARGLGTGYKMRLPQPEGAFDVEPWQSGGAFACDSVRGPMLYGNGEFEAGEGRFVVERIVLWDTGETVYSELPPND